MLRPGIRIVCPIIWHLSHHQTQKAIHTFHTNLSSRKQVRKLGGGISFHDLVLKQILGLHFEIPVQLQREPQAQRCQSERVLLCSPQFTDVTSHHFVQIHSSSVGLQLTLSSSRPNTEIHTYLCLSGWSFLTVSTSLRAYI